jgi:GNAT superfamily N-acetyltransferase
MMELDGYTFTRLEASDEAALQDLHERCSDYYEVVEGGATRPSAAREDLAELPPGKAAEDRFYFGIHDPDKQLVGALVMARDYPSPAEWWLALLLLDPRVRGRGLGARLLGAAKRWVRSEGGQAISLTVLERNARAERFWRANGFVEESRKPFTAATGLRSQAIVMRLGLS